MERQHFALLLSGGGARAAYQVGVLKALTHLLPRNHGLPFPIICGNSAGAINATALACYASCYHLGVRKLEWVWRNFHTAQVYGANRRDVFGYLLRNYLQSWQQTGTNKYPTSLLNNAPLRKLLRNTLDFQRIDRNILRGQLRAICVTASSYSSHDSVSFFQGQSDIAPWQREQRRGVACQLDTEHLMASSAIPLVFPTVKLDDEFFGDGSVHQLSPLSPPIHLGARKILIIGVEQPEKPQRFSQLSRFPRSAEIAGHLLDTLFADTLHADLERAERVNQTLAIMNDKQRQQTQLKPIQALVLNPSVNFTALANRHYHHLPSGIRSLLRLIGVKQASDSSLLSYLLFEQAFCRDLIKLGWQDGMDRQQEIKQFLEL
ncbi:patatin-like phospholipase family protein [Aestuariibacter halophilus]|uniref:Patatin-like phospholipase family protein n=1 Tax=Fluctibacter halophilus TaxID=226011 RepID=A0ABS8GCR3_9ALTE|nr:patatin-like phospholipase family protein [Aestuariibacter halophilus]MCC2618184.1 patatin-like phospholipase family protein [Aestuariibacter halophilus]